MGDLALRLGGLGLGETGRLGWGSCPGSKPRLACLLVVFHSHHTHTVCPSSWYCLYLQYLSLVCPSDGVAQTKHRLSDQTDYCRISAYLFARLSRSTTKYSLIAWARVALRCGLKWSVTSQSLAYPLRQAKSVLLVLGRPITSATVLSPSFHERTSVGRSVSQSVSYSVRNHQSSITRIPHPSPDRVPTPVGISNLIEGQSYWDETQVPALLFRFAWPISIPEIKNGVGQLLPGVPGCRRPCLPMELMDDGLRLCLRSLPDGQLSSSEAFDRNLLVPVSSCICHSLWATCCAAGNVVFLGFAVLLGFSLPRRLFRPLGTRGPS